MLILPCAHFFSFTRVNTPISSCLKLSALPSMPIAKQATIASRTLWRPSSRIAGESAQERSYTGRSEHTVAARAVAKHQEALFDLVTVLSSQGWAALHRVKSESKESSHYIRVPSPVFRPCYGRYLGAVESASFGEF
jgi:hypothetical protein